MVGDDFSGSSGTPHAGASPLECLRDLHVAAASHNCPTVIALGRACNLTGMLNCTRVPQRCSTVIVFHGGFANSARDRLGGEIRTSAYSASRGFYTNRRYAPYLDGYPHHGGVCCARSLQQIDKRNGTGGEGNWRIDVAVIFVICHDVGRRWGCAGCQVMLQAQHRPSRLQEREGIPCLSFWSPKQFQEPPCGESAFIPATNRSTSFSALTQSSSS